MKFFIKESYIPFFENHKMLSNKIIKKVLFQFRRGFFEINEILFQSVLSKILC